MQIADLKHQVNQLQCNLSNRVSEVQSSVQNISSEVYRQLEKEASLLADSGWNYGEVNLDDYTVELQCSISPKEYQPEVTEAVLVSEAGEYPMTLENGAYIAKIEIPIFEESQVLKVQFREDGLVRTEALNWYLSPRYECLPTAFVESGGWSFSRNEDVWVLDLNGEVNIFLENKGGKFRAEEILLIQCIDGEEISREELPMEQMSAPDYYCELEKKIEVPFGCTFDLYIEVVDNYGLHHRNWLEHKIVDDAGNPVDENHDWWYGGEGRRYF